MSDTDIVGGDPDLMHNLAAACSLVANQIDGETTDIRAALFIAELPATALPSLHEAIDELTLLGCLVSQRADELAATDMCFAPNAFADLHAELAARLNNEQGLVDEAWLNAAIGFLAGDLVNLWTGGDDGLPLGQVTAGAIRVGRTALWMLDPKRAPFPTFNTGFVGQQLSTGLQRFSSTARLGQWLRTPGATTAFRRIGVAAGVTSTVLGVRDLINHGNPIDAFQREGAGYVADVAGTAFSASTTAFFLAPNPVTGTLVVVTGAVWVGAEIVDHWDDITDWASERWDDLTGLASATWDHGTEFISGPLEAAGNLLGATASTTVDLMSDTWDTATGLADDTLNTVGDLTSGALDTVGNVASAVNPTNWF